MRLTPILALTVACLCFGGAAHAADSTGTPVNARPGFGALDAKQRSQIQSIGQTLLAAKGSLAPSSEEKALLDALHNLAATVDSAATLATPSIQLAPDGNKTDSTITTQGAQARPTRQGAAKSLLDPKVAILKQRRSDIEALPEGKDAASQVRIVHAKALAQQAAVLEQAVTDALATPDDTQRLALLTALRQRLKPKTLDEVLAEQAADALAAGQSAPAPARAPTITTITRHRPGPDDVAAGAP